MKIILAGGGTGGHFYPLIAIAQNLRTVALQMKLLDLKLYFLSDSPYDKEALFDNEIAYEYVPTGRLKILDFPKIIFGVFAALWKVYKIYPDVVVGKGGFASFPVIFAAWILGIPVFIHESDSIPGKVNRFAARFAKRIAVSFEEAGTYFPKEKTAWTGQPIRSEILYPAKEGFYEYLKLDPSLSVILVLGGSQGAEAINEIILEALPRLTDKYQIIHQVGTKNLEEINIRIKTILPEEKRGRYYPIAFLNPIALKMAAGAARLVISRAGSSIFEIASWGLPSIIIPLSSASLDHQRHNAFNYARAGAATVIDEANLSDEILIQEIENILGNYHKAEEMKKNAEKFAKRDAAEVIAKEIINIALEHEK